MRQRRSQIVFLLLLLCAVPLGEPHVLGLARTFAGSGGLLVSSAAHAQKSAGAAGTQTAEVHAREQQELSPEARLSLQAPRPALHPGAQAAAVAGYTGFARA